MMKNLRIVHITPFFTPSIGGVERTVEILSRTFADRSYDICVITSFLDNQGRRISNKSIEDMGGIRVIRLRHIMRHGYGVVFSNLSKTVALCRPDIIHAHVYRHPHTLQALTFSRKARLILNSHAPFPPMSEVPKSFTLYYLLFDTLVSRYYFNFFDIIIATSKYDKEMLLKRGSPPSKTVIIPNPIDKIFFNTSSSRQINFRNKEHVILYVGRIHPQKRLETIVYSLKDIDSTLRRKLTIVFVGPSDKKYLAFLLSLAKKASLNLLVLGALKPEDLRIIYQSATVFVLPSLYEAFSLTLAEAMASGLPVVTSARGGPEYILGEKLKKYCYVNPYNRGEFAKKIINFIEDEKLWKYVSTLCRLRALTFHPENIANLYEKTYYLLTNDYSRRDL